MEAIPCCKTLEKHHIQNDDCASPLCGHNEETLDDTLLCSLARSLWFGIDLGIKSESIQGNSLIKWLDERFQQLSANKQEQNNTIILIMLVLDCIQKSRNEVLHNNKRIGDNVSLQEIKARSKEYISIFNKEESLHQSKDNHHMDQAILKVDIARLISSHQLAFWSLLPPLCCRFLQRNKDLQNSQMQEI